MENNGLYDEMMSGLGEVHLSLRARKQAEGNMRRAAAIVEILVGKSGSGRSGEHGTKSGRVVAAALREKAAM